MHASYRLLQYVVTAKDPQLAIGQVNWNNFVCEDGMLLQVVGCLMQASEATALSNQSCISLDLENSRA